MRHLRSAISVVSILAILTLPALNATAQNGASATADAKANATSQNNVKLERPSWQTVLDKLFGTPDKGLLDGKAAFQFQAENLKLTADQSAAFFSSSSTSSRDLAALVEAAAALHGQVRMDGTIEGRPFELKLAGRELKIEGLTLTAAQRDALTAELRGIPGLREAKVDALVDGRASRIQLAGGRDRIEPIGRDRDKNDRGEAKRVEIDRAPKVDIEHKIEIDRPGRVDARERVETSGRIGGTIEKPELPRLGK